MTGAFGCLGVKFITSFFHGLLVRYFLNFQKPPTTFTPLTGFITTFDLLIQIALSVVVLSYLERKINQNEVGTKEDGNFNFIDSAIFALGILFGIVIWVASPIIFGEKEAFDSAYYGLALVGGGALCGLLRTERSWRWVIAILIGQLSGFAILVIRKPGALWPLGVIFIIMYSAAVFLGTILGSSLNDIIRRF